MEIVKTKNDGKLTAAISGRIDTTTAPQFDEEINSDMDGVKELVLDFGKVAYISSAGLRVLLSLQKTMNKQGSMVIINAGEDIREIFDVTGFDNILNVK